MRTLSVERLALLGLTLAALPAPAWGGGFDVPDVGTEALGRGGAFVAKADSGLAMYYNVAGLAQQRGTRLMLDVNLIAHNAQFTREGKYPGTPCLELPFGSEERRQCEASTPWAGQPYPTVGNRQGFGYQPFLALSTDFGYFQRWTFGLGVFSPPGLGSRQYGARREFVVRDKMGNDNTSVRYEVELPNRDRGAWDLPSSPRAPSPARYDTAETNFTILTPAFAVAASVLRSGDLRRPGPSRSLLDAGAEVQWVLGQFDLTKANLSPLGPSLCGATKDHPNCDSYATIKANSMSPGFVFSLLGHPTRWLDLGLTYRPQVSLDAPGWVYPTAVAGSGSKLGIFPATFSIKLPHIVRWGIRGVSRYDDGTERFDVEVDGTWENWSVQQAAIVRSGNFELGQDLDGDGKGDLLTEAPQRFKDSFSIRAGSAYNARLGDLARVTFRLGGYFDSASTNVQDTNLTAYSTEKLGLTLGLGYRRRGFWVNLAYAAVFMPDRVVTGSQTLRAGSATNGTRWVDGVDAEIYPANGRYQFSIHTVSLGLGVNFDELGRDSLYAN